MDQNPYGCQIYGITDATEKSLTPVSDPVENSRVATKRPSQVTLFNYQSKVELDHRQHFGVLEGYIGYCNKIKCNLTAAVLLLQTSSN